MNKKKELDQSVINLIIDDLQTLSIRAISKKHGISQYHVFKVKRENNIVGNTRVANAHKFVADNYKGLTHKAIAAHLGITIRNLYGIIFMLKKEGKIKK